MSFFQFLEHAVNGVATSVALKQAQGADASPAAAPNGGRKLKRKSKESCTPCAAMGDVDNMRKTLGFSSK